MQIGVMTAVLAAVAQTATPPVAGPLVPTGKWTVEYADSMCLLSREYGTDAEKLTLVFRNIPLSTSTDIVLIFSHVADGRSDQIGKGVLTIGPSGRKIAGDYKIQRQTSSPESSVLTMSIPTAELDDIAKSETIMVSALNLPSRTLALKGNIKALAALKSCNDDLLREWKIDPAESDLVAEPPKARPSTWLADDDYPTAAKGAQGKVTAVFTVGLDGLVSDCRVVISSGTAVLDTSACRIIVDRMRYTPAIGKDGKPMATHKTMSFNFARPQ
jgi:TonB family protein